MTPTPASSGPDVTRLYETFVAWRKPFAILLVVLGVSSLIAGGYCFRKAFFPTQPTESTETAADPLAPEGSPPPAFNPYRSEYLLGGVVGVLVAVVAAGCGAYLLGRIPRTPAGGPDGGTLRTEAIAGGVIGLLVMILGGGLFILWFGTLVEWLGEKGSKDAWKVITALLVFLVGGGLVFVSTQLVRADERNDQTLRRVVFGTNAALSLILLIVALVAVNLITGLNLPARLDTRTSLFDSLHPDTARLIADLKQPVVVYTTFSEEFLANPEDRRMAYDLRRLLELAQKVNPTKFQFKTLSPQLDKTEITRLQNEHAEFKRSDLGVLVVTEGKPGKFVPESELFEFNQQTGKQTFQGEPKLVSLILAVTEEQDNVVYFVQGHGEIAIGTADGVNLPRTGRRLVTALEQIGAVVKPLTFDLSNPKVPDDAAVVVLADPRALIPAEQVSALQAYMATERPNKKKGKLIVLSSPHPNADGAGVVDTGLSGLLAEYGLLLGSEYLMFNPTTQLDTDETDVIGVGSEEKAVNPIAIQFARRIPVFVNCREVAILDRQRQGVDYLFVSNPARVSWVETGPNTDPLATWTALRESDAAKARELIASKRVKQSPRPLAATVSDGNIGRLVVYGSGDAFADPDQQDARKLAVNPELLAGTVNWLRDRPAAANITGKEVTEFQPDRAALDGSKGVLLPVGGTLIVIIALGLGVWAYRRS